MAAIDATGGGTTVPEQKAPDLKLDLTKDTVTRGDKTSGLGEVFVQMDTNALADDVADLALSALKSKGVATPWPIRVVTDPAALRGADVLAVLTHRTKVLSEALDAAVSAPMKHWLATPVLDLASVALQGVGIVSKLFAHDYHMSGRSVVPKDLGFDLLVAQKLTSKHSAGVSVTVDRIAPSAVASAVIAGSLSDLDARARSELAPRVTAAGACAASAVSDVAALTAQRDALNAQLVECIKVIEHAEAAKQITAIRAALAEVNDHLTMARATAATCQAESEALAALAKEIETFVTSCTTTPADGRAPLVEAARAEAVAGSGAGYVLYVRLVAGGMDEIVDVRTLRSDTWTTLAGATVEFALLDGGTVVTSGVRSTLQATEFNLGNVEKTKQDYVRYADVPAFQP